MYGFALSGFCMGLGSKLANGDIIYHTFIGVARLSSRSLIVTVFIIVSAVFFSWLLDSGHANFLAN